MNFLNKPDKHLSLLALLPCVLFAVLIAQPTPASACPGCQNPNLPMTRSTGVLLPEGRLRLGVSLGAAGLEVTHEAGCRDLDTCDSIPKQPLHFHEQIIVPIQLTGHLEWGITDTLGLEVNIPVRTVATTVEYSDADGNPYEPAEGDIHHRNEVLIGLGDPTISARMARVVGNGWWLIGRVGTSIPLGSTEPDPFKAGDELREHQHIQFGNGTFDPILGAEIARSFGRWQSAAYGRARLPVYENSYGFQAGNRWMTGLLGGYRFADRALVQASAEYLRDAPERWSGKVQQDGILGRQEVLLGSALVFSNGGPQYTVMIRVPVYREIFQGPNTEEGEIFDPVRLQLGCQWSL